MLYSDDSSLSRLTLLGKKTKKQKTQQLCESGMEASMWDLNVHTRARESMPQFNSKTTFLAAHRSRFFTFLSHSLKV